MVLALVPIEWIALILGLIGSVVGGVSLYVTINTSRRLLEVEENQTRDLQEINENLEMPNTD